MHTRMKKAIQSLARKYSLDTYQACTLYMIRLHGTRGLSDIGLEMQCVAYELDALGLVTTLLDGDEVVWVAT